MIRDKVQKLTDQFLELADGADATAADLASLAGQLKATDAILAATTTERDKLLKDVSTLTEERDGLNQRVIDHEAKCIQHEAKLSEVEGRYAEYERRLAEYAEHPDVKVAATAKRKQAALEARAKAEAELAALEADDGTVSA